MNFVRYEIFNDVERSSKFLRLILGSGNNKFYLFIAEQSIISIVQQYSALLVFILEVIISTLISACIHFVLMVLYILF